MLMLSEKACALGPTGDIPGKPKSQITCVGQEAQVSNIGGGVGAVINSKVVTIASKSPKNSAEGDNNMATG